MIIYLIGKPIENIRLRNMKIIFSNFITNDKSILIKLIIYMIVKKVNKLKIINLLYRILMK